MEKPNGITILSLEGGAGVVRNKDTLPVDWKNGLNKYLRRDPRRQHPHEARSQRRGGVKIITFTVKIRCHKDMDVADELDSASIDLADDNLNSKLKGIKCAYDETDLMALMTYSAMGK